MKTGKKIAHSLCWSLLAILEFINIILKIKIVIDHHIIYIFYHE